MSNGKINGISNSVYMKNKAIVWVLTKRIQIVYWIATLWLGLGMFSTGLVQLLQEPATMALMTQMGYPAHFLILLGAAKLLGVVVILIPGFPLVKEWAYAGFFFIVTGAAAAYIAVGNFNDLYHLGLFLVLIALSWYFRPAGRKLSV